MNALFKLPVDVEKADSEKAAEYLAGLGIVEHEYSALFEYYAQKV